MADLSLSYGGYSSAGVKSENQDAFAVWHGQGSQLKEKGVVAAMADGVSACAKAKEAANSAVTTFVLDYLQTPVTWTVKRSAQQVLQSVNRWCYGQNAFATGGGSQAVTTFSGLIFKSNSAFVFHAGDSRIYRYQNGDLEQLTLDHCIKQGRRSVLSRALGIEPHLDVDFKQIDLQPDDIFVMTTDGVHQFITTKQVKSALQEESQDLEATSRNIVQAALTNGSDDNLSCLLLKVNRLPSANLDEVCQQLTRLAIPPALKPGMKLEGMRVLEILFNGTRSSLYKVIDDNSGQLFSMKTPSEYFADNPAYLSSFLREEWIGQHLRSPYVMKIFPRPAAARFMYHLCEYIEGQTLRQWMIDNPSPALDKVRRIARQLIAALRVLQRQQMVHRDVKPENVMINGNGEVKLIDFGAVLVAAQEETGEQLAHTVPLGAVNYIAPEYLLHNTADFRSDQFSCATVLYEMLCGDLPYQPASQTISSGIFAREYKPLIRGRPDLPAWLDVCLKKALQPNPVNRYAAFSEFETALESSDDTIRLLEKQRPLIERKPVLVWQCVSALLFIAVMLQLVFKD
ncbi:bifunctional protein-serine/threonine kinase/phosphatase [Alteromonas pelagimontana]|uniref:Bifunctional protein-serine/threonine kinase/phosphatase n=1 Tax=Alteromonas pelagimontana TaxID=1858656 RepID=A0A6M4MBD0_9ALTE|nr:bifunctional protein-serine/threonine kinase/phosphatase [Alteromonas pelagimontana]QJR80337.1 bifunctional protein-serine/threonine kinase/phosphatase [Alteromonas pelagimontana]